MPCECDYSDDTELRAKADAATRAACDMRTIIRRFKLLSKLTLETRAWIQQHDKEDRQRIAEENENGIRERVKQSALDKLSLEERRVLGL